MLVIKRKRNQKIYFYDRNNNDEKIMEMSVSGPVKLAFEALPNIRIVRDDVVSDVVNDVTKTEGKS